MRKAAFGAWVIGVVAGSASWAYAQGVPADGAAEGGGHWVTQTYTATCWGSDRLLLDATVTAYVTNGNGTPDCTGGTLEVKNVSSSTFYFGLSGVVNNAVAAGQTINVPLAIYRGPKDTQATRIDITARYLVSCGGFGRTWDGSRCVDPAPSSPPPTTQPQSPPPSTPPQTAQQPPKPKPGEDPCPAGKFRADIASLSTAQFEDDVLSFDMWVVANHCFDNSGKFLYSDASCKEHVETCEKARQAKDADPRIHNQLHDGAIADMQEPYLGQTYTIVDQSILQPMPDNAEGCTSSSEATLRKRSDDRKAIGARHLAVENEYARWLVWKRNVNAQCAMKNNVMAKAMPSFTPVPHPGPNRGPASTRQAAGQWVQIDPPTQAPQKKGEWVQIDPPSQGQPSRPQPSAHTSPTPPPQPQHPQSGTISPQAHGGTPAPAPSPTHVNPPPPQAPPQHVQPAATAHAQPPPPSPTHVQPPPHQVVAATPNVQPPPPAPSHVQPPPHQVVAATPNVQPPPHQVLATPPPHVMQQQLRAQQEQQEAARRQQQEEAHRAQQEAARRQQQEDAHRAQQEEARRAQQEAARRQQQEEARRAQQEEARRAQQEEARRQQQEEARRQAMEERRRQQEEERRRQQEEARRQAQEEARRAQQQQGFGRRR